MSVFFLPIIAMVFFTVFPSIDLLRGVIAGILVTFVHYAVTVSYTHLRAHET